MLRPMTSDVSALSGSVANGHQAIHSVSPAPSKIPYGGFSPVRLQTRLPAATFARGSPRAYRPLPPAAGGYPLLCPVNWTCVPAERASRRFRPSRPVALGSASGCSVRQPHRLLWPHPSFCAPRRVYRLMPAVLDPQKVPTFICQSLLTCRRPYSDGSSDPSTNQITDLAFAHLAEARQPYCPHTRLRVVGFTKLQRSHNAAARQLACPALDGAFTTELACPGSRHRQVGHDYRNIRLIPDRTCTGCSVSLVGCTPNEPNFKNALMLFMRRCLRAKNGQKKRTKGHRF